MVSEHVLAAPVAGYFAADSSRYGRTALRVLNEPIRSMSMTDLKARGDMSAMRARNVPAAPALISSSAEEYRDGGD